MAYTTIKKSSDYFETTTYTGGATDVSSLNFQPDLVWTKKRDGAEAHGLFDSVRGATKALKPSADNAEATRSGSLTSFDSDGWSMGGSDGIISSSGYNYVGWSWKANGAGSSNTDGDITSTVSANTTSGFSIVQWTGNGTAGSTVGHGLGSEMKFMILKDYSLSRSWITYHHSLGGGSGINFNENGAAGTSSSYWNDTDATSSVFSTGVYSNENNSNYICYCFSEVKGFSKFGSYTGNGNADGNFVYLGFKPALVLVKNSSLSGENWVLLDNKRNIDNPTNLALFPNLSNAESGTYPFDFVSNGFKIRDASASYNRSGDVFIFMAFAEAPLVGSNNVPTTAR